MYVFVHNWRVNWIWTLTVKSNHLAEINSLLFKFLTEIRFFKYLWRFPNLPKTGIFISFNEFKQ